MNKRTKILFLILISILISSCIENKSIEKESIEESGKIKVLNFGTFHFGETTDGSSTEFDETDKERQKEVREISRMIAKFKPTIICVERIPEKHEQINLAYQEFLKTPSKLSTEDGETSMIAYDVARLCNVKKIHGIDNKMGYNFSVGDFIESSPELKNDIDSKTYLDLTNHPYKAHPELAKRHKNYANLSLFEKLKFINDPIYLENSIIQNADKLMYVGLDGGYNGADNAAIFYNRNMRIFSNLNRIKMDKTDRVFILMGSAHTAFLKEFISRSPKFEMVNTLDYLK